VFYSHAQAALDRSANISVAASVVYADSSITDDDDVDAILVYSSLPVVRVSLASVNCNYYYSDFAVRSS
jgi:hypothetical protein